MQVFCAFFDFFVLNCKLDFTKSAYFLRVFLTERVKYARIYACVRAYVCVCVRVCACVCMRACACIYTNAHTYIYVYIRVYVEFYAKSRV